MTDSGKTQYTPGQSVTLIDAEGKRGLGQISDTTISVRVDFDHIDSNGAVIEAGSRWPLSRLKAFGLQILPEPFTEPKDADQLSEDGYRWGDVAAALGGTITEPKGDSVKPLTADSLGRVIYDWLDDKFGGALPGGVQKFADDGDHLDPGMKHEARCEELAAHILAALSSAPDALSSGGTGEGEPRFYIEHGLIHDRMTGKHVSTDEAFVRDGTAECLALLNSLVTSPTTGAGQELVEAAKALLEYADHRHCRGGVSISGNCDCGYPQAADRLRTAIANTQGG